MLQVSHENPLIPRMKDEKKVGKQYNDRKMRREKRKSPDSGRRVPCRVRRITCSPEKSAPLQSAGLLSGPRKEGGDKGCDVVVRRIGIALTARARELKGHDIACPLIRRSPCSHSSDDLVDGGSIPKRVRSVEKVKRESQRSTPYTMCDNHARDFLNTAQLSLRHGGPNGGPTALWLCEAGNFD